MFIGLLWNIAPHPAKIVPDGEQTQVPSLTKNETLQHTLERFFVRIQADNLASRLRFLAYWTLEAVKMVSASQMNRNETR